MPPPYAPALRPPFSVPQAGPVVWLHVDEPSARLQQLQHKWVNLCVNPCGVPVDPGTLYRVGGGTTKPSHVFRLPRSSGEVHVRGKVGSNVKYWVGAGLSIGGAGALAGGGALWLSSGDNRDFGDFLRAYSMIYIVAGVVLLAVGLPFWLSNDTSVEVQ